MKVKFSTSILTLIIAFLITGLQVVHARPVDENRVQITGKVVDQDGHPVPGATIRVVGTPEGAVSESDGEFLLRCPADSSSKITVEALGYQKITMTLDPQQQKNNVFKVELQSSQASLADVTVSAMRARSGSVDLIYTQQKNASAITDGISQDIIRKSPDKNMGDVLKRVSGASIQEDKFVIIRGLSERYNTAQMNKALLPSTEPDKRAFAFDIIPASLIDQVLIYKSMTPDLPPDFAGGAIDITTKDFPNSRVSELSLSLGYDTKTTFKDFNKARTTGKLDFLGYFDNKRQLPSSYLANQNDFSHKDPALKQQVTKQFPNSFGYQTAGTSLPDMSIAYTGGNTRYTSTDKKFGYIYSLGYSVSRQVKTGEINDFDLNKRALSRSQRTDYSQKYSHYALLNLSYALSDKSKIAFKNLYNNGLTSRVELVGEGVNLSNDTERKFISAASKASRDGLLQSVLQGEHELATSQHLNWNLSYARTFHYSPDETILTLDEMASGGFGKRINNENSPTLESGGRIYSNNVEQQFGGHVDYDYGFSLGNQKQLFKAGLSSYYRDKNVDVISLGYSTLDSYGIQVPASQDAPFDLFSDKNIDDYRLTIASIGTSSAKYKGKAYNHYGYLMFENKWANDWTLIWGANISHYDQRLTQVGHDEIQKKNTDILPSGILTYRPTAKMNIRLAGSESVNRPEFRELVAFNLYDYDKDFIYFGNPDLQRSKATNLDFRYEYFPGSGEILSASVFYKKFNDPIEQINYGNSVLGYQNADEATLYGAEVELRKKLDFLGSAFMSKWTLYGNAAYIDGNVRLDSKDKSTKTLMQGQSPYLVGAGLNYTEADFSFNLLYQKAGARLAFRGQAGLMNIYENARDVLDAQVSYKFLKSKKLELRLSAKDLLAQSVNWYYKYSAPKSSRETGYDAANDMIIRKFTPGTNISVSLKYAF